MRLRSFSSLSVLLALSLLGSSVLLTGCPAAFAPTNPLAASRADSNVTPGGGNNEDSGEAPASVVDPSGPAADGANPASGGPFGIPSQQDGKGGDIASNANSGTIAAAGDTADAGKERLTITFRKVRYGHNLKGQLPDPPATGFLSANPQGPTDLPLLIGYLSANSQLLKGYPEGSQIRLIFYPEVITKPTTYVDGGPMNAFNAPVKAADGPNFLFNDLDLGKGTLEIYSFEDPIYDETGSYAMAHTADYHEGDLIPFADPSQLTDFLNDTLHVHHVGTFKVIYGYATGNPH
ncbi:MAG TPA: hypothetical protein VFX30_14385 [bacterium]|nr:hypothetical protein [bacterium]